MSGVAGIAVAWIGLAGARMRLGLLIAAAGAGPHVIQRLPRGPAALPAGQAGFAPCHGIAGASAGGAGGLQPGQQVVTNAIVLENTFENQ